MDPLILTKKKKPLCLSNYLVPLRIYGGER